MKDELYEGRYGVLSRPWVMEDVLAVPMIAPASLIRERLTEMSLAMKSYNPSYSLSNTKHLTSILCL